MNINIKGKDIEVKYTFNSFKYMGDFDLSEIEQVETKPFKLIPIVETLLIGGVNNDPRVKFTILDVSTFLEEYVVENAITDLLEELMELLQASNFFKSLQKNQTKKKK